MSVWTLYLLFVVGILLSLLLPVMLKWLREARDTSNRGFGDVWPKVWAFIKPYVKIAVSSAVVGLALVIVFLAANGKSENVAWYNAIIYGFGWDSAVQKLFTK